LQIILMLSPSRLHFHSAAVDVFEIIPRKTTHISCDVTLKHDVDKDISPPSS
jgi:hypothetical protein